MPWTAGEIRYALTQFSPRRRISAADIAKALSKRRKEIESVRQRLAELESLGGSARGARRAVPKRRRAKRAAASRRKLKLSTRVRAQRRLQGKYMGYVRRLAAAQKAEVRKVRQEKGWREAIRMAARLVKARALGSRHASRTPVSET